MGKLFFFSKLKHDLEALRICQPLLYNNACWISLTAYLKDSLRKKGGGREVELNLSLHSSLAW